MKLNKLVSFAAALCILSSTLPFSDNSSFSFNVSAENNDITDTISFTEIGQFTTITLSGTDEKPDWYCDNENVATVSLDGTVKAVGEGTAYVYAVFKNQMLKFAVNVTLTPTETEIELQAITLSNEHPSAALSLGSASTSEIIWSTSDKTVATVDNNGVVTAVSTGSCKIFAVLNGVKYIINVTSTYIPSVTVTEVAIGSITLSAEKPSVKITLSDVPEGTTIVWSSSDNNVATVDSEGIITAVSIGSCRIIAEINGVKYIAEVKSEYKPPQTITEVILGDMAFSDEVPSGTVVLSGVPDNTYILWSSSDEQVAKVDSTGLVTAVSSGRCQIIALINGISYIMNVTSTYTPKQQAEIKADSFTIYGKGKSLQLSVKNSDEQPEWISMAPSIVTVDENGLVTSVSEGEGIIIAKFKDTICKVTITVTSDINYGDANCDGEVALADAIFIMQSLANPTEYPISEQGIRNADVYMSGDGVNAQDALSIQKYKTGLLSSLPEILK